jgi:IMP dehydrogenase
MLNIPLALTFDDVLIQPSYSNILPSDANLSTQLSPHLSLATPFISAAMDTVTETAMAIELGKLGGIGVIHRNMSIDAQSQMVASVKAQNLPKNLLVGAAIGATDSNLPRAKALINAGVDLLVIDTAHGHSQNVANMVQACRALIGTKSITLMAGNIATAQAAEFLFNAGADVVKVGIGPGAICTTRVVAGVGVPQLSAIMAVAAIAKKLGKTCVADGGLRYSGDIAKALAAGANAVMMGSLLAGTTESPGEVIEADGQKWKTYRGMGSTEAMQAGSAERYGQKANTDSQKLVPEGVAGRVAFKGDVAQIIHQLAGGVQASFGYVGVSTLAEFQTRASFVQITAAGRAESHPHSLQAISKASNYGG